MALEWCARAKIAFPASNQDEAFWSTSAARLFENAIERLEQDRFDAVVVDEGQDFHESWWDSVEWLNRDLSDGPLYVFHDPAQQLQHQSTQRLPKLGTPFVLPCNCRNTQRIASVCAAAIKQDIRIKTGQPEGREPVFKVAADELSQRREIAARLQCWLAGSSGVSKRQVAILCPTSIPRSSLRQLTTLSGVGFTDDLNEWRADKAVLVTTLRRFKGLEADAVILFDVPEFDESVFTRRHFYVACSRAKHLLCVIAKSELLLQHLKT